MKSEYSRALLEDGYCIIEGAVSSAKAAALATRCRELHLDPGNRSLLQDPNDDLYQTLFGLANLEAETWSFAAHAEVLTTVHSVLESEIRIGAICSKWG